MTEREELLKKLDDSIPALEKMHNLEEQIINETATVEKLDKHISGIGVLAVGLFFLFAVFSIITVFVDKTFSSIFGVIPFGLIVAFYVLRSKNIKNHKEKLSELNADYDKICKTEFGWIPEEFQTSENISKIYVFLDKGQAETKKEAFNLLGEELRAEKISNAAMIGAYLGSKRN